MKESNGEGIANHTGPESCVDDLQRRGEALTGECAGWVLSLESRYETECRRFSSERKATSHKPTWQGLRGLGGVGDPMHARKHHGRESGDPAAGHWRLQEGPHGEPQKGTAMTNGGRESDSSIVSGKPSNKVRDNKRAAERVERRELAKGSPSKRNRAWTQSQTILQRELERVREASRKSLRVNTRGRSPVR